MKKTQTILMFVSINAFTATHLSAMKRTPSMLSDYHYAHSTEFNMGKEKENADKALVQAHALLKNITKTPQNIVEFIAIDNLHDASSSCREIDLFDDDSPYKHSFANSRSRSKLEKLNLAVIFAKRYQQSSSNKNIKMAFELMLINANCAKRWAQRVNEYHANLSDKEHKLFQE